MTDSQSDNPNFITLESCQQDDRVFVYHRQRILSRQGQYIWNYQELAGFLSDSHCPMLIERVEDTRYIAVHVDSDSPWPADADFVPLREILLNSSEGDFRLPGLGNQLTSWYQSHRFCGSCGHPTEPHPAERALICSACQHSWYPRINPCVIVLVTDGDRLLLARHTRYRAKMFSCLAGFVEAGETPEETVSREVREEAGIEIANIRYIKSQSWPFPSQLMLGFFADYVSGDLQPEAGEIEELRWFTPEQLPSIPSAGISVAGQLIQLHCERFR
ncbi:MAG: NAD(+) diphosphatase [Gammaproteobacteria bacterium]|nr:NAD(+) diphosphatase [Gammaproteobacteria bacterium]